MPHAEPPSFAITANWLAYSNSLKSGDIAEGIPPCVSDLSEDEIRMVELPIAHMDSEITQMDDEFWLRMRQSFDEKGIAIASVHGPIFSLDRYSLEEESARLKIYARVAALLGSRALVVHPVMHANLHVCGVARQALSRDIALASRLGEELEGTCCRLAIENVPHNSWAYLKELFAHLPPSVGMCFDTGHYQVRPEGELTEVLKHFAGRIACWHLNDNDGLCDAHLPPGKGEFDWLTWKQVMHAHAAPRVIELSNPARWENPDAREITRHSQRTALVGTEKLLGA